MIWKCTCKSFPEQYDIYTDSGFCVAYFRVRHGLLYVHPYVFGKIDWETELFFKEYEFEIRCLDPEELENLKRVINRKIRWYLIKQWFKNLWN